MKNVEEVWNGLWTVAEQWCHPSLLDTRRWHHEPQVPSISFEVAQNQERHIVIRIKVRHDPFGQTTHVEERTHLSINYIDMQSLTNQLFSALTWKGSPYHIVAHLQNESKNKKSKVKILVYRWRFEKAMEVMG